jgi:hypothetical protein
VSCRIDFQALEIFLSPEWDTAGTQDAFDRMVDQGYQASQTWHQGELMSGLHESQRSWAIIYSTPMACKPSANNCCIATKGSLVADEAGARGDLKSTVPSAKWAFSVTPTDGWGPRAGKQQATAGWLAALPVFEPHWQVRQFIDLYACRDRTFSWKDNVSDDAPSIFWESVLCISPSRL